MEELGLNKSESRVYLKLLEIGSCKAGRLARETGLNRTTIYKALDNLIEKGLVGFVVKENRKYFQASDPRNLLNNIEKEEEKLKKKKESIKKAIPELSKLFETSKEELEANVFKGLKGLKTVFNDILKRLGKGDEYIAFGVPELAQQFYGYFDEFNKNLKKNNVKGKIIFDERATKNIASCQKYDYQVRTLSKEFMSPAEVNIYKDKVAVILWSKTPIAFVIKNKEISKSFKSYFELLWKIAKK